MKHKVWLLLKVQLLSFFGVNKALHKKGKRRARSVLLLAGFLSLFVLFLGVSFFYSFMLMQVFHAVGRPELLLALMMVVCCLMTLFTTIYKSAGTLYGFRDYDMIMSLPVSTSAVVASRILLLYAIDFFFTVLILLPAGIVYAIFAGVGPLFWLLFLLTLFAVPLIPIVLAAALGALVGMLASHFRRSGTISGLFTILLSVGIVIASTTMGGLMGSMDMEKIADFSVGLLNQIFRFYPPAWLYIQGVCEGQLLSLFAFLGLSAGIFMLFAYLIAIRYRAISSALSARRKNAKFKMTSMKIKTSSAFAALLKKEGKRFLSSGLYMSNAGIGLIMALVAAVALLFVSPSTLESVMEIPGLGDRLPFVAPYIFSFFISMVYTATCSISLEGKSLWVLKSAPVPPTVILKSKIAFNLSLTLPVICICGILVNLVLRPGLVAGLFLFLTPIAYALLVAIGGILLNLALPNLDWTNEATVIKQSAATSIIVMGSMGLVFIPALLLFTLRVSPLFLTTLVTGVILAATAVFWRLLHTWGARKFQTL